jgi:ATP-dependent RNA helicase DDX20
MNNNHTINNNQVTFQDLPLHQNVKKGLDAMDFVYPSSIQLTSIPIVLFGNDLIGQAKSGTGKTAVFGIAAVEHVIQRNEAKLLSSEEILDPCVLILAPTREIALQIHTVIEDIAKFCTRCVIRTVIGGVAIVHDQV